MTQASELKAWLATIHDDHGVAVDDGGLTLVELDPNHQPTGAYLEVGGIPEPE